MISVGLSTDLNPIVPDVHEEITALKFNISFDEVWLSLRCCELLGVQLRDPLHSSVEKGEGVTYEVALACLLDVLRDELSHQANLTHQIFDFSPGDYKEHDRG